MAFPYRVTIISRDQGYGEGLQLVHRSIQNILIGTDNTLFQLISLSIRRFAETRF